jgi:predicted CoA-binding protein
MAHSNEKALIRSLKNKPATWAVVGLSGNTDRTAYRVTSALQSRYGKRIIPVHPTAATVHGEQGYASLADIPDGTGVDVVDCFVRSDLVGAVVDAAIAQRERLGIGAMWLQLGVVDEDAADRAKASGLAVVMDTCPLIEWPLVTR